MILKYPYKCDVTTILSANKNCCLNMKLKFYNLITILPTENDFEGRSV